MNIGKTNKPIYVCDKCGEQILGYHKNCKKHIKPNKYFKADRYGVPKKEFDLCEICEKRFREWLKTKEVLPIDEIINRFSTYKL